MLAPFSIKEMLAPSSIEVSSIEEISLLSLDVFVVNSDGSPAIPIGCTSLPALAGKYCIWTGVPFKVPARTARQSTGSGGIEDLQQEEVTGQLWQD
mmetsp:Transcript_59648/g.106021  ORF Transcript_59648/g.106021 Transcript_59648/m.106021 type:complete len:96 (-) Transcript_59648:32-319(-)